MADTNKTTSATQYNEPNHDGQSIKPHCKTLRQEVEGTLAAAAEKEVQEKQTDSRLSTSSEGSDSSSGHSGHALQSTRSARSRSLSRTISEVRDGIENRRDLELGPQPESEKTPTFKTPRDPNLVAWDGPNDPGNPKQWSMRRKWAAVFCVSCFTLLSPVSSSMVAPALEAIGSEFNITSSFEKALVLSIFVLAYAIGPLAWGPLSEIYGRIVVLQLTNILYMCFNLGCGLARTKGQIIAFRFFAGLGGSAPLAIGGGVLADLFEPEQRGKAISIYTLMPMLGPAVGPIAGGFVTQNTTWRWIFYSTTILTAVIQFIGIFVLQETYAPVLLTRRKNRLIEETGNAALHTEFDNPDRTMARTLSIALTRPFRLLITQPLVQFLALYMMYLYGLMYLVLSTFPALWTGEYGQSVGIGGLNYISLGLGFFIGAQTAAPMQDRIYAALKRRYVPDGGPGRPEFRVPMMIPGALLVPAGLLIYGWTAQSHTHWIAPNIGAVIFCIGVIVGFQCIQGYLVDTYTRYAASAVAAATVLRSLAGFGFPLFAPSMYEKLGYGWGNSVLALMGVAIGWPGPLLLWKFGPTLRKKSQYAAG
ncbi:major facilitator superfamily transporter [Colletotrichum graminicola]|uniref:Major facilitator superfamily transporter n=1 Tax=Colletotrichum graminicola (strain M1.001 / M2 / FGSC 10212) TaxID=645133 RepID=E3QMJ7_COLGM|nr:major facilitator superfamily transporter [Colletotrichum graminicola M1.001]EFQ32085.1 major facilitator superfamily transporter [Colletotrichum graminicola M1.001]WDK17026.1 major facilitator superfamily transporter [Colletotrichum graminicola]